MSSFKRSLIQLHVFVFLAGLTAPLGNLIQLNGLYLVFYRMLLTVLALVPIYLLHRQPTKVPLKDKGRLMLIGVLIAIHWVCFYGSIKYANVSIALSKSNFIFINLSCRTASPNTSYLDLFLS